MDPELGPSSGTWPGERAPVGPRSAREVFAGRLIRVVVERWPAGEREVVHHPDGCVVVAFTLEGSVLLVRQSREAVRRSLLELPAGVRAPADEGGAACAARELLEETGYRALRLEPLGRFYSSPGFTDEALEFFLADAEPAGRPAEPGIEVVRMALGDALRAVREGRIVDAKTALGLLLARHRRDF
ncbi:MAG TPA: NUDIX hydrolase [Actinomycetota bacterium]|nr:NUDIX hydrolase [Actinomycetota bacterium]